MHVASTTAWFGRFFRSFLATKPPQMRALGDIRMKKLILLILIVNLQGCAGFSFKNVDRIEIPFSNYQNLLFDKDGDYFCCFPNMNYRGDEPVHISQEVLFSKWGEPQEKIVNGPEEIWVYRSNKRLWSGLIPYVAVPIPLILPLENQKHFFTIKDNQVAKIEMTVSQSYGAACGPFLFLIDLDNKYNYNWFTIFCASGKNFLI